VAALGISTPVNRPWLPVIGNPAVMSNTERLPLKGSIQIRALDRHKKPVEGFREIPRRNPPQVIDSARPKIANSCLSRYTYLSSGLSFVGHTLPKRVGDQRAANNFASVGQVQFPVTSCANHRRQEEPAAQERSAFTYRLAPSNFHSARNQSAVHHIHLNGIVDHIYEGGFFRKPSLKLDTSNSIGSLASILNDFSS
jgi:hypothetical protein